MTPVAAGRSSAVSGLAQAAMKDVEIPTSIPRLTTQRVLTMSFVEGRPHHPPQGPSHDGLHLSIICTLHVANRHCITALCCKVELQSCPDVRSQKYRHPGLSTVPSGGLTHSSTKIQMGNSHAHVQRRATGDNQISAGCVSAQRHPSTPLPSGLQERGEAMPPALKAAFAKRLLARVAEAYGRMLLLSGLFQVCCSRCKCNNKMCLCCPVAMVPEHAVVVPPPLLPGKASPGSLRNSFRQCSQGEVNIACLCTATGRLPPGQHPRQAQRPPWCEASGATAGFGSLCCVFCTLGTLWHQWQVTRCVILLHEDLTGFAMI